MHLKLTEYTRCGRFLMNHPLVILVVFPRLERLRAIWLPARYHDVGMLLFQMIVHITPLGECLFTDCAVVMPTGVR